MGKNQVQLFDKDGYLIIVAEITENRNFWIQGKIIEDYRSPEVKSIFNEYADCVNNQIFSLLDKIESQIENLGINMGVDQIPLKEVQIFDKMLSFKLKV